MQDRVDDTGRLLAPGVVMLVVLILVLVSGRTKKEDKNCVKVHLVEGNCQELMVRCVKYDGSSIRKYFVMFQELPSRRGSVTELTEIVPKV